MISQYRERLARRCREVGLTEEQCELWLARCVDRVSYEELARARGCHPNTARNHVRQICEVLTAELAPCSHAYEPGCCCVSCELHVARQVLDCLRNVGMAAKRPERAPMGQPGPDGRAWPLRGPVVTAEDLVADHHAVLRRCE